jgi:hypothetical protein
VHRDGDSLNFSSIKAAGALALGLMTAIIEPSPRRDYWIWRRATKTGREVAEILGFQVFLL